MYTVHAVLGVVGFIVWSVLLLPLPSQADALRIVNVSVRSGRQYPVKALQVGQDIRDVSVYTDRDYTFAAIPLFLDQAVYIVTANEDKFDRSPQFLTFAINKPARVYVLHDDRHSVRPTWLLLHFQATGHHVYVREKGQMRRYSLFHKDYPAGMVTLGGNYPAQDVGNNNMYSVIVAASAIDEKYQALRGPAGPLGAPMTAEVVNPDQTGRRRHYQHGAIYWSPTTGAHVIFMGPVWDEWVAQGFEHGVLGYPLTDEHKDASCGHEGLRSDFENGYICRNPGPGTAAYIPTQAYFMGDTACPYGDAHCNRCVNQLERTFQHSAFDATGRYRFEAALAGAPHYSKGSKARWHDHIQGFARLPARTRDPVIDVMERYEQNDLYRSPVQVGKPVFVYTRARPGDAAPAHAEGTGFFIVEMDGVDGSHDLGYAMNAHRDRDRFYHGSHGRVRRFVRINDTDHPGGIQIIGHTLAVAAQCSKAPSCKGRTFVEFYDLSNWKVSVRRIQRVDLPDGEATGVAITHLPSGYYLMFVMGSSMDTGRWFLSDLPALRADTGWTQVDTFDATRDEMASGDKMARYVKELPFEGLIEAGELINAIAHGLKGWSVTWTQPQNAAFVSACETGDLYMITSGNSSFRDPEGLFGLPGRLDADTWHETADLYKVTQLRGQMKLDLIAKRRVHAVDDSSCTFRAAGGVHVDPTGHLVLYCSTHHPEGGGDGEMKFEEYNLGTQLR